jgi:hypothetical protein
MLINEEEKKDILGKYKDDTSDELLTHLKRTFPVTEIYQDWMKSPMKFIYVDDKTKPLLGNKKYLVSLISHLIEDEWSFLGAQKLRRTVKKYLDGFIDN